MKFSEIKSELLSNLKTITGENWSATQHISRVGIQLLFNHPSGGNTLIINLSPEFHQYRGALIHHLKEVQLRTLRQDRIQLLKDEFKGLEYFDMSKNMALFNAIVDYAVNAGMPTYEGFIDQMTQSQNKIAKKFDN